MLSGCYLSGDVLSGQAPIPVTFQTFLDRFRTARADTRQPLWLELFDIDLPDGSTLYLVDFADPDARGTVKITDVVFEGNEYIPVAIARTGISEEVGAQRTFQLTIVDPLGLVRTAVLENLEDLGGSEVRITFARYDLLRYGLAEAWQGTTELLYVIPASGGSLTFALGRPSLFQRQFPRSSYHRHTCDSDYALRFNFRNECTYPSNEFEAGTVDNFKQTTAAETVHQHGWYAQNTTGINFSSVFAETNYPVVIGGETAEERALYLHSVKSDIRWLNGTREGFFVYRRLGDHVDEVTDFDVSTKLYISTARSAWHVGILCQSVADERDWILWGPAWASSTRYYRARVTVDDVSSDTDIAAGAAHVSSFRMVRAGNDVTLYYRDESVMVRGDSAEAWVEAGTFQIALGDPVRIGLVAASDVTASINPANPFFFYFRFAAGGLPACDRGLDTGMGCNAHANGYQFNGKRGMPDELVFIR